jgi:hypothetical protein
MVLDPEFREELSPSGKSLLDSLSLNTFSWGDSVVWNGTLEMSEIEDEYKTLWKRLVKIIIVELPGFASKSSSHRRRSLRRREMCANERSVRHVASPKIRLAVAESSLFRCRHLSNKYRCSLLLSLHSSRFTTTITFSSTQTNSHHHTNTFTMAARSRLPLIAGLGAATFGGYYMYRAGGSPKVAEKQMESMYCLTSSFRQDTDQFQTMLPACHHQ